MNFKIYVNSYKNCDKKEINKKTKKETATIYSLFLF